MKIKESCGVKFDWQWNESLKYFVYSIPQVHPVILSCILYSASFREHNALPKLHVGKKSKKISIQIITKTANESSQIITLHNYIPSRRTVNHVTDTKTKLQTGKTGISKAWDTVWKKKRSKKKIRNTCWHKMNKTTMIQAKTVLQQMHIQNSSHTKKNKKSSSQSTKPIPAQK